MAGEDFVKLMTLIHIEKYEVESCEWEFKADSGAIGKVVLEKSGERITLSSKSDDFVYYVASLKTVVDGNGDTHLRPVANGEAYYRDVEHLSDQNHAKVRAAAEKIQRGEFKLDFQVADLLDRFLFQKLEKKDDPAKLKDYYYEIFATLLFLGDRLNKLKEQVSRRNPEFEIAHRLTDEILRMAFMSPGKKIEPVRNYKFFKSKIQIDLEELGNKAVQEKAYVDDLFGMLSVRGTVEGDRGIRYVLDVYRRFCELSFEFINALRISIELADGNLSPVPIISYHDNLKIVRSKSQYSALVACVNPNIRHAESHVDTRIEYKRGVKGEVILYDSRRGKEVGRLTFEEITDMTRQLLETVYPALFFTFGLMDVALRLLALESVEYKLMLVTLSSRKKP